MIGGRLITRIRSVRYKRSKEKELLYGAGNEPVSIQSGNVSYAGDVSMLRSEYETLCASGNGSVLDLQVDIVVSYGNPPDPMVTDKLMGCQFTEEENTMGQGDKNEEITLPFLFLRKVKA